MTASVESDDIYVTLVADLSCTGLPIVVMGVTLAGVGLFVAQALGYAVLFAAVASGVLCTACKLVLVLRQMRRLASGPLAPEEARRWEWAHVLTSVGVASSVGAPPPS